MMHFDFRGEVNIGPLAGVVGLDTEPNIDTVKLQVSNGSVNKPPIAMAVYSSGSWKTIQEVHTYTSGSWVRTR